MGKLYIVSTPIGNLGDISKRMIETLTEVDLVLCEDTRRTGKLLHELQIPKKDFLSFTDYNEKAKTPFVIEMLNSGKNIALLSDGGTPLISDPGYYLIKQAILNNIPLDIIPGPSAVVSAVVLSGLPSDRILFWGFLPKKPGNKREVFKQYRLLTEVTPITIVFYESPFRIRESITLLDDQFPNCTLVILRELTKLHQEILRGYPKEILYQLSSNPKGEITAVLRLNIDPKSH
ncbi:MAG: Ribosomal RNA small subunit methyltransferase I [Microgenomates group bacterium GW2011_GWA2_44_7]|uniref:Ribosomal RNA small subunit methyltransferase I n=1 Tax=Candidatus Woesebacteria bacterium GW2011_GWA1_43_12 TaxID=1618557 RepID=A0A0G1CXM9_9BACT|nr:MAG: Ribosomal RNA small subunit methyltransferase I [Candidatus Woesebacteria bacterium GW2011_GWA1_43_12]KKT75905.1 MAG: Ribosomal RNA small subunit methyltransferase I [Microgenomates group bacterium GW2011_GWA2_44_7]KKT78475.1 MAG: Ribosomal RNA small subunit methyltransferase I [Microgenomates group bacterium GW2011_GWB1_44_8]